MITITDPDFKRKPSHLEGLGEKPREKEKWYGAAYRNFKIPDVLVAKWDHPSSFDSGLHLPGLNQFIATDFSLRCDDDKPTSVAVSRPPAQKTEGATENTPPSPPQKILETAVLRLWHKMDSKFRVPKINSESLKPIQSP